MPLHWVQNIGQGRLPTSCGSKWPSQPNNSGRITTCTKCKQIPTNCFEPFPGKGQISCRVQQKNWPGNLIEIAKEITNLPSCGLSNPEFKFFLDLDQESAQKNLCAMKKYDYNLTASIEAQKDSPLTYGSEFKSTEDLDSIFAFRLNWNRMKSILKMVPAVPWKNCHRQLNLKI